MTKDDTLKLALEAIEGVLDDSPKVLEASITGGLYEVVQCRDAITAIKEALANEALEKMAENARELGLDYEPAQPEQHQDWCASLTQMLMSMPPKPAPCNCKPKPEQPKVRTGNCLRVGVCASEGHKIAPQRTWVGLTRTELIKCGVLPFGMSYQLYEAIEAKLKEKNETN